VRDAVAQSSIGRSMFHIYGSQPGGTWVHVASSSSASGAVSHYSGALRLFPSVMVRNPAGDTVDLPGLMDRAGEEPARGFQAL
jgi:hypothetical protein